MSEDRVVPPALPERYQKLGAEYPDVIAAVEQLGRAVRAAGPLGEREILLVKLALAIGARMEGATHAHVRKALAAGVEPAAVRQVALLAAPTIGFPNMVAAMAWVDDLLER